MSYFGVYFGGGGHLSEPLDGIVVPQPRADGVVSSPPWKCHFEQNFMIYDSMSDLGEIRVYQRADFQSGSRVLKKVF